jgi:hypothetical protein
MALNPLQQARQIGMTVRTMRIKAETAYLEAQRKQTWVREQQDSLRLQHTMHDAPRLVTDLTAWILVVRNLDAGGDRHTQC